MKKIKVTSTYNKLTENDILATERSLGIVFPTDYRDYLREYNGCNFYPRAFPLVDHPQSAYALLEKMYCIASGNPYNLVDNALSMKDRLPYDLMPVAEDPGGNLVCIAIAGEHRGKIYFWDHEGETINLSPTTDNIYFVSNSFLELIDLLVDLPED